ncbi:MAG TPA: AAA family ATPase [Pilimelia sp.]|nr:AAA family ATPase [Pilimelia sp.]
MSQIPHGDILVGRDPELDILRRAVTDAAAGQGGVVWIEGEPGVGKSTLLAAGLATAYRQGCRLFRTAADEVSQPVPLQVMLRCLPAVGDRADLAPAAMPDILHAALRPEVGWAGDPVVATSQRLLASVHELCAASPVIIAVDDLQWADEASLLLWHRLSGLASQMPLLLVGACRAASQRPEIARVRRAVDARDGVVVPLVGLAEPDAVALVGRLFGAAPGPELRRLVREHAAGNPLYLRELTEALRQEQAVRVTAGVAELVPGWSPYDGPTMSLSSVITRRLDPLPADVRDLLHAAALLGNEFAVTDLGTVVGRAPADLVGGLQAAMAVEVVVEAGDRLAFRHPLIRHALYQAIPAATRVARHRQAAQRLAEAGAPADRVAEQLLRAPAAVDPWLVGWLGQAASTLTYRAPQLAIELLTRVVENLRVDDPAREALAADLVTVLFRTERNDDAERRAREVLATTTDPERGLRMRWCLTYVLFRTGRIPQAQTELRAALRDPDLSDLWRARLQAVRATILACGAGDIEATEAAALETLELGESAGDVFTVGHASSSLFFVHAARRDYPKALSVLDRGLSVLGDHAEHGDLRTKLLDERIFALHNLDRLAEAESALRTARRVEEEAREAPATRLHVSASIHYFWLGRWDDALAELAAAADNLPDVTSFGLRARWPILLMHGVAALIAGHRGEREVAAEQLRQGRARPMTTAADLDNCDFLVAAGALAAESDGRRGEALAAFAPYLEPGYGRTLLKHQWLPGIVRLALDLRDAEAARTATRTCEHEAAMGPSPRAIAAVDWCRGLLDDDPDLLLTVADRYRAVGRRFELAQVLEDAAVTLACAGRTTAARASLAEATDLYADLGAGWDIGRAEDRMRAYGIRRGGRAARRRPASGWEALSATEVTVAHLVAEARSNAEIAALLSLSSRTVQTHVSHILTKLGGRSRVDIAKEVLRHPPP